MAGPTKITGKAVTCTIAGNRVYQTKITPKPEKEMADSTDASNYDPGTALVWKSQIAVMASLKLEIEGKYDKTATTGTASFAGTMFTAAGTAGQPVAVVVTYDGTNIAISGNFDVTEFEPDMPIDNLVTFTATLSSNGPVVFNTGTVGGS